MNLKKLNLANVFPWLLTVGGAIGLVASFILTYDTLSIAANPHYIPACNLNPVVSCGDVINATGDKILGLPYPYFGIAAFAVLITIGVGMLAGAVFKRWFWLAFQAVISLGILGAYGLLLKSMFSIHALCPFCLSVDVVTTIIFWYGLLYIISKDYLRLKGKLKQAAAFGRRHHLDIILFWFLLVFIFILHHFWYYYGKHI